MNNLKQVMLSTAVSLLVGGAFGWGLKEVYGVTIPYSNVDVIDIRIEDQTLHFMSNFKKTQGCDLRDFAIVGSRIKSGNTFLNWRSQDNSGQRGNPYDRPAGENTLDLSIDLIENIDTIEIRTIHICNGKRVDAVFYTINLLELY